MSTTAAIVGFLGKALGPIGDYFDRKRQRKHEEFKLEMGLKTAKAKAAAERVLAGHQADVDWEIQSIKNSGWKDEYLTILTSVVLVLIFIPQTQPLIVGGLASLDATPLWFQLIMLMVYASAFGIRIFDNFMRVLNHGK